MTPFVKRALELLNADKISAAISYIRKRLIADRNSRGLDKIDYIENSYNYLLKFLIEGQPDPERERIFIDLREKLYSLVRSMEVEQDMKDSLLLYYSQSRSNSYSGRTFSDALGRYLSAESALLFAESESARESVARERSAAASDVFSVVWTLPIGRVDELKSAVASANNPDISEDLRLLIVAALTQNLLFVYDRDKLLALLDIYRVSSDEKIKARVLMGIILVLDRFRSRAYNDYELKLRFEALGDSLDLASNLRQAFLAIVKVRGSLKLMKKIEAEILPDLMKMGPSMMDLFKGKDGKIDIENIEMNPRWEKMMSGGMEKKLRKLGNLHNDGGDIMLSMFAQLSARFHYFNEIDVWFRPFSPAFAAALGVSENFVNAISALPLNGGLSDLDKYALILNFSRLPESARNLMVQSMKAQSEQLNEELKSVEIHDSRPAFSQELESYSRNLFRFYNFFRLRLEFYNPFSHPVDLEGLPFIGEMIADDELLAEVGEFYFRQGFYEDSIGVLKRLASKSPLERALYCQKIGFAYEKLGHYEEAFKYYTDDSLVGSEDEWLLKKIAKVGKLVGAYSSVNSALSSLREAAPEKMSYIIDLILLKLEHPELDERGADGVPQSEKLLGRAYYQEPENPVVLRLMARKSLMDGEYEEAKKYLSPRISDISLYLAGASLQTDQTSLSAKDEELAMIDDLLEMATVAFAVDDLAEGIKCLSMTFLMKQADISRDYVKKRLSPVWALIPALSDKRRLLPLYLEAALSPA